jgi:hypothetical protein
MQCLGRTHYKVSRTNLELGRGASEKNKTGLGLINAGVTGFYITKSAKEWSSRVVSALLVRQ